MMKRIFDLFLSMILVFMLSPLFAILIFASIIFQGFPIFFIQERPGKKGKLFKIIKFRTMLLADKEQMSAEKGFSDKKFIGNDSDRITKYGQFLRTSSLDEIPELFNVIKGEMSLVGPRPLLVEFLSEYTSKENIRHQVLPGITGLAQVKGRNNTSWRRRLKYDNFYVSHKSLAFDIKILFMTFSAIKNSNNIDTQESKGTALPFKERSKLK